MNQGPHLRATAVGIREDGTIDRAAAPAVTNPADLHAVEAALRLADDVWALTMGPPAAEAVLREVIALGAHHGVLLCDRALAGSDTWATANALAAAIVHMGNADVVLCGMSALDGETAQVGPEVACRLDFPQATCCEDVALDNGRLVARRIVEGGFERLSLPLPALVTVAETGFVPRYPTMLGRRRAAAAAIERLSAADVGVGPDRVGLAASPTKVAHMTPVQLPERRCRLVGDDLDFDALAVEITALLSPGEPGAAVATPPAAGDTGGAPPTPSEAFAGTPAVLVVCELYDSGLSGVSAELVSRAAELAPALGGGVGAVVAGGDADGLASAAGEAARFGADVVYVAAHPELAPYRCQPHARVLADLATAHRPAAILFGATTTGRDLAPRVAGRLDTGLAADCTDLTVGPWERRHVTYDALLHQIRPAMAGGVLATCVCPEARPQMATVRPGVFTAVPRPRAARRADVAVALGPADLAVTVLDREVRHGDTRLADADVVVAGGAGCDASSWHLLEDLADAVGGRVAASRAAVEAGLAPRPLQVGQTGTTVHPSLYVACGISGALQHAVGMRSARTVLAVNRDPDAFIFRLAHFGVVADVADALPPLAAAFRRAAPGRETAPT